LTGTFAVFLIGRSLLFHVFARVLGWLLEGLRNGWRFLSFVGLILWNSIPSYLPFYLLVIVVFYAAVKGRKRVTVISPFHLPSSSELPFGEHTVANALRDALVEIHKRAKAGGKDDTYSTSGLMTPKLEGIKFSEAASFEVPNRFAVEVKGLSHDAIISFARKVFGKEWVISGDVVGDTNGFRLLARHGTDLWCSGSNPATMEGLRRACGEVALRMLGTIDTNLLSAYTTLRASDLIKLKKLEEVLELMKEAASLLPSNALIAYDLGVTHARRGDNDKAIAALKRAIELNNNFPEALNNLGIALGTQGKYNDAIQSYKKAISLRPDYYAAHFNLGTMFLQKGRYDEALRSFEEALKIKSTDPALYFNLGYTFHAQKRYAEAIDRYRNALEKKPNAPEILTNLGISLFDDGQVDEAIRVVERAAKIDSDNEEIKQILRQMKEDLVEEDDEDEGA